VRHGVGGMRYEHPSLVGDEHIGEFLRRLAMAYEARVNPVFEGHRTTYPGETRIGMSQAIGFGFMYTSPGAVYAVAGHQLLTTPGQTVGIEASPQGSYHLGGGDTYYPFKGIVDVIFK